MKKLKVTWQDGSWNRDGDQPIATAEIPEKSQIDAVGDDTLVFRSWPDEQSSIRINLAIPAGRLISVIEIEVQE